MEVLAGRTVVLADPSVGDDLVALIVPVVDHVSVRVGQPQPDFPQAIPVSGWRPVLLAEDAADAVAVVSAESCVASHDVNVAQACTLVARAVNHRLICERQCCCVVVKGYPCVDLITSGLETSKQVITLAQVRPDPHQEFSKQDPPIRREIRVLKEVRDSLLIPHLVLPRSHVQIRVRLKFPNLPVQSPAALNDDEVDSTLDSL